MASWAAADLGRTSHFARSAEANWIASHARKRAPSSRAVPMTSIQNAWWLRCARRGSRCFAAGRPGSSSVAGGTAHPVRHSVHTQSSPVAGTLSRAPEATARTSRLLRRRWSDGRAVRRPFLDCPNVAAVAAAEVGHQRERVQIREGVAVGLKATGTRRPWCGRGSHGVRFRPRRGRSAHSAEIGRTTHGRFWGSCCEGVILPYSGDGSQSNNARPRADVNRQATALGCTELPNKLAPELPPAGDRW